MSTLTGAEFDAEIGVSVDDNYIYVANDGPPDEVLRISYAGVPEFWAGGPGVDISVLLPAFVSFYIDGATGGTFDLVFYDDLTNTYPSVSDIPYDIAQAGLSAAIDAELGASQFTVLGNGTDFDPFTVTSLGSVTVDVINGIGLVDGTIQTAEWRNWRQQNAANHVEAIGTDVVEGVLERKALFLAQSIGTLL